MNPPVANVGERDPSKLSLITPGGGEYHLTRWVEEEGGEKVPLWMLSTDIRVRILHSAEAFLAWIKQRKGLKKSLLKTEAFLAFYKLQSRNENLCCSRGLRPKRILARHWWRLSYLLGDILEGIHL